MKQTPHVTRNAVISFLSTNHITEFIILSQQLFLFCSFSTMQRDLLGTSTSWREHFCILSGLIARTNEKGTLERPPLFSFSNNPFAERLEQNVSRSVKLPYVFSNTCMVSRQLLLRDYYLHYSRIFSQTYIIWNSSWRWFFNMLCYASSMSTDYSFTLSWLQPPIPLISLFYSQSHCRTLNTDHEDKVN